MKKIVYILFLLTAALAASTTFDKTFGGEWDDYANSAIQTSDGGYLVTGCRSDSTAYKYSFFVIIKTDSFGEKEWEYEFCGMTSSLTDNAGHSVIETSDGGYVITGCSEDLIHAIHADLYVTKLNSTGVKMWDYRFGYDSSVSSYGYQIIQTEDGGFVISGENFDSILLVKLDHEGNEEWTNNFYSSGQFRSVIQTEDKGYFTAGQKYDYFSEQWNVLLCKVDSLGNEETTKFFGSNNYNEAGYYLLRKDNNLYIAGYTDSLGSGVKDIWIIKTDINGNEIWSRTYGGVENDIAYTIEKTLDGCLIIAGTTESYGAGGIDAWLIKTDLDGNELWNKTFGGSGNDELRSVQQALDGGYILAGYTDSFGAGGKDMWIIKTDETGTEIESPFLPLMTELYQNYPNPFNPTTEISFDLQKEGHVNLTIYNSKGELVRALFEGLKGKGMHTINFDASGLDSGIYFYKLTTENHTITRKMLFLK
ncbi:MAG: T9SS type A sorting domain-containing protein [Candidatus Delongbacteria bacterium]|nr:T9SS type A sorting domain-containing protein [Candidatus Delongbacteria bacterium]